MLISYIVLIFAVLVNHKIMAYQQLFKIGEHDVNFADFHFTRSNPMAGR